MKQLFISIFYILISFFHLFLNFFNSKFKFEKILFIDYEPEWLMVPFKNKIETSIIISHYKFNKKTFFYRKIKGNRTPFNRIIKKPFFSICFSKKSLNQKLSNFYEKNYSYFLKRYTIKKIILCDEYSLVNYALIKAAKKIDNCKSIALQHGIITPDHYGYIYPKKLKNKINLPDYLIVYGNYEYELLTKHSIWDKKQVLPLGCPRYDFLVNYKIDKNKLKEKLGIPKDKKILFWPTQTHDPVMIKNGENELNTNIILKTIKDNSNWFLIIKFHPNENQEKSFHFYNKYKQKYGLKNVLILKYDKETTHNCILCSDAVILTHSTTGMEGLLMNKPIINLASKTEHFLEPYKELKSCLLVRDNEDLDIFLNKIISKNYLNLFKEERKKHIEKHYSNLGNSTKKIIKFIKKN